MKKPSVCMQFQNYSVQVVMLIHILNNQYTVYFPFAFPIVPASDSHWGWLMHILIHTFSMSSAIYDANCCCHNHHSTNDRSYSNKDDYTKSGKQTW